MRYPMVGTGLTWEEGGLSPVLLTLPRKVSSGIYLLSALGDERDEAKDEWGNTRMTPRGTGLEGQLI